MLHRTHSPFAPAAALTLVFFASVFAVPAHAATPPDQAQPAPGEPPAKPMKKKEPMAGEMKKDGMMKEDVSKAAQKWDQKMKEMMEKEKTK